MPVPAHTQIHSRSLLRDDVYRSLRKAIVEGTLEPGEQLTDGELSNWLGVSRTPIREALLALTRSGLVISRPGHSTIVAPLDARAALDAQAVAAAMHELAVRQAVPLMTVEDIDTMRVANAVFAAALKAGDAEGALEADDTFHAVAVEVAANRFLRDALEAATPLLRRIERIRFSSLAGRGSVAQHAAIVEACEAGDADTAAAIAGDNWRTLEPLLLAHPE